jgi:hypothetical protein
MMDPGIVPGDNSMKPKTSKTRKGNSSMKTKATKPLPGAMAFYHQDGLPAAWQQASTFAGDYGRLATMPDICDARLGTKPGDAPWENYFTTLTAEYYGFSRAGNPILIVAHGIGPMSTLEGACKAYAWEYKDKERNRRGGRITQREFEDLEDGKYGDVHIVCLNSYSKRYQYPFIQILRSSEALTDPVLKARFGYAAEKVILAHTEHARAWHREQAGIDPENKYKRPEADHKLFLDDRRRKHMINSADDSDPFIIQVDGAANCSYGHVERGFRKLEPGYALGHLVSTGCLSHMHHEGNESLTLDVSCHEWWNGVRLVGVPATTDIRSGIRSGPDAYKLLRKHWRDLFASVKEEETVGFRALVKLDDQWFTQYPKEGARMDNWEPEYKVTSLEEISEPVLFRTTVGGYHGFFKYGINEVQAIAPPNANAYYPVGEIGMEWKDGNPTHHTVMVQFCQVKADASKRMIRADAIAHNYDLLMELAKKEAA